MFHNLCILFKAVIQYYYMQCVSINYALIPHFLDDEFEVNAFVVVGAGVGKTVGEEVVASSTCTRSLCMYAEPRLAVASFINNPHHIMKN